MYKSDSSKSCQRSSRGLHLIASGALGLMLIVLISVLPAEAGDQKEKSDKTDKDSQLEPNEWELGKRKELPADDDDWRPSEPKEVLPHMDLYKFTKHREEARESALKPLPPLTNMVGASKVRVVVRAPQAFEIGGDSAIQARGMISTMPRPAPDWASEAFGGWWTDRSCVAVVDGRFIVFQKSRIRPLAYGVEDSVLYIQAYLEDGYVKLNTGLWPLTEVLDVDETPYFDDEGMFTSTPPYIGIDIDSEFLAETEATSVVIVLVRSNHEAEAYHRWNASADGDRVTDAPTPSVFPAVVEDCRIVLEIAKGAVQASLDGPAQPKENPTEDEPEEEGSDSEKPAESE